MLGRLSEAMASLWSAAFKSLLVGGTLLTVFLSLPNSAPAQTCTWGNSANTPPSAVSLRSYREFLRAPGRVAVDNAGNLYATDPQSGQASIRDQYGRLISVMVGFSSPLGIAVDGAGRIYLGEQGRGSVSIFDPQWNLLAVLGQGEREFAIPNDIAVDPLSGWIYVSDSGANTIKVYGADGTFLSFFGGKGTGPGQFDFPAGLYLSPAGELFVADQNNDRIQVLDPSGNFKRCIGGSGPFSFSRKFGRIQGLTGDAQGRLYVADAFQGYVQVFDPLGHTLSMIGSFGDALGQLRTPMGLAIDFRNRLLVGSANNARVELFGLDAFTDRRVISAAVDIKPDSMNRYTVNSYMVGQTITAYIELRDGSVNQIDVTSITANDVPALSSGSIGDYNGNGIPDLMVQFDARSLLALLPDGDPIIVVSGRLMDGNVFEGSDMLHLTSEPIPAVVDVQPATLTRGSDRKSVTAYIEIGNYPLDQIALTTITANGVPAAPSGAQIGDYDADGIPDLAVKFNAQAVMATLPNGDSTIVVSGNFLDGTPFTGSSSVRVKSRQ